MTDTIYLLDPDGRLVEMNEHAYATEDLLQKLLEDYPSLLAGGQMDEAEPRRWLLVSREMPVPGEGGAAASGYLDHLFLDQDAVPTLVEVKRSTDTRIRREVVGQMLDYAANAVVYWPVDRMRSQFGVSCQTRDLDPVQVLTDFLGVEGDPEEFWARARTNLQAGKIRLVFVADVVPSGLRRIVEFLNGQMDPAEVLAVEIRQYAGAGLKTLVPRVIGQTTKKSDPREKRHWDEPSFFQELESRRGVEEVSVARRIFEWVRSNSLSYTWGKGVTDGSFLPYLDHQGARYWPISLWTSGSVSVQFQWLLSRPPFDAEPQRVELLRRLNAIPGVSLPESVITRRPSIRFTTLLPEGSLDQFLDTLGWVVEEIRRV